MLHVDGGRLLAIASSTRGTEGGQPGRRGEQDAKLNESGQSWIIHPPTQMRVFPRRLPRLAPTLQHHCCTTIAVRSLSTAPHFSVPAASGAIDWSDTATYTRTRRPIDEATTLPGAVYHDPTFYDKEKSAVWQSSWVVAAEATDLKEPGDVIPVTVGDQRLILANDKGTIRAFHNVCRHRGAQLVSEKCSKRRTILCPYHRWGYALDGRLMGTPSWDADESGKGVPEKLRAKFKSYVKEFDKKDMGLYPVRVDTKLGLVFVNLNGDAPPLTEWLGDLLPALEPYTSTFDGGALHPYSRKVYDVQSNWKMLIENFLEYYHLPAVHPDLCNVSGVDEHQRRQGKGMYMCFVTSPLNGDSTAGPTPIDPGRIPPFPGLGDSNLQTAWHVCLFPNVFFSLYPDHFFRVRAPLPCPLHKVSLDMPPRRCTPIRTPATAPSTSPRVADAPLCVPRPGDPHAARPAAHRRVVDTLHARRRTARQRRRARGARGHVQILGQCEHGGYHDLREDANRHGLGSLHGRSLLLPL